MAPNGWGKHSAKKYDGDTQHTIELFAGELMPENTGGAFTCIEVAKKTWFQDVQHMNMGSEGTFKFGIVFTSLTRKLVECHSVDEVFTGKPRMKCVQHKEQFLCKRKRLNLNNGGEREYTQAREDAFKEDPSSWDNCASFDEDIAASF